MAIIPTSGEFVKVPEGGGGVLICTVTNGTLDKTMGEILTALENGVVYFKTVTGYVRMVYVYLPVSFDHISGKYYAAVGTNEVTYSVRESTEAAALAAYPTEEM